MACCRSSRVGAYAGAANPITRPATTGSMPLLDNAPQSTTPRPTYTSRCCSRSRTAISSTANATKAGTSGASEMSSLYTIAITASATRSSTTKTVSTNTRMRSGMSRPNRASRPSASAVSVDMATPQPCALKRPALIAK